MPRDGKNDADSIGSGATALSGDVASAATALSGDAASAATAFPAGDAAMAGTVSSGSGGMTPATPESLPVVDSNAYTIIDELARGGLGRIMRARDRRTGRVVAIKEMLTTTDDAAVRFVREAMVTANLQHPCIVPVYEVGRWPSGQPFYAMKLVSGRPLNVVIEEAKDTYGRLALVPHVVAVADALAYAHGERVIHRDLKPHNVICGAHGETVVIDWGLARRLDEADAVVHMPRISSAPPGQTYVGAIMGTPSYMPPEQAQGKRVDQRADVYAIGAILYHALSGSSPFTGSSLQELIERVKAGPPPRLAEVAPQVPADLVTIVERAMARDPKDRYPSAAELAVDLRRFTNGQLVLAHVYSAGERLRRFAKRQRAPLAILAVALATLGVVGGVSIRNIVAARNEAQTEKQRADIKRDESQDRLVSAYIDRARVELDTERPERALAFAVAAADQGALDRTLRFVVARALDAVPAAHRFPATKITAGAFVPGSHDLVIADSAGVTRWSPDLDQRVWNVAGDAGDMFALDARTMIVGRDTDIALISLDDGKIVAKLIPPRPGTLAGVVGLDRDQRWLAAPSKDGFVHLYELATRTLVASIPVKGVGRSPIVSPDGQRILVSTATRESYKSHLMILDRAGKLISEPCTNCYLSASAGQEVAFAAVPRDNQGPRVGFVDWNGRVRLELTPGTTADVMDIRVDLEHGRFAMAMQDGMIEMRELATGLITWRRIIDDRAYEISFDKHGRIWVLGGHNGIRVLDGSSGAELAHWHHPGMAMLISDDEARAATLKLNVGVVTWSSDLSLTALAPTPQRVRKLVFVDDGRIVTGSDDGTIAIFENGKARPIAKQAKRVSALHLLPDGTLLSASPDETVIRALATGAELIKVAHGPRAEPAPDGTLIATGGEDARVVVWERATGKQLRVLGTLLRPVMAVHWSPNGRLIGAIDEVGTTRVWDRDGKLVRELPAGDSGIDLAFSHDGRWLVRAGRGGSFALHSLDGGADRPLAGSISERLSYVASFGNDDRRLVMAGTGFVAIWDVATGSMLSNVAPHTDIPSARFSPDGRLIYGGGVDRKLRVWDAETATEITTILAQSDVYSIAMNRDGSQVAALTLGAAMIWRTASFTGDAATLRSLAACRSEYEVVGGFLRTREIAVAACNRVPLVASPNER